MQHIFSVYWKPPLLHRGHHCSLCFAESISPPSRSADDFPPASGLSQIITPPQVSPWVPWICSSCAPPWTPYHPLAMQKRSLHFTTSWRTLHLLLVTLLRQLCYCFCQPMGLCQLKDFLPSCPGPPLDIVWHIRSLALRKGLSWLCQIWHRTTFPICQCVSPDHVTRVCAPASRFGLMSTCI